VRKTADPEIGKQQYAVIAPTLHCSYTRATENTIVGERSVGDARLDYDALTYGWFDFFLKGEKNGLLDTLPKIRYYTMGMNKWQTTDTWPPRNSEGLSFYLSSDGGANTRNGNGTLTPSSEWQTLLASGIANGARNTTLTKLTGHLLRRYVDPRLVLELMQATNAARCLPPLPEADVLRIVDSICGKELKRRGHGS
jgi:hypothetical protein